MARNASLCAAWQRAAILVCVVAFSACERTPEPRVEQSAASPAVTPPPAGSGEWGQPNINVCALLAKDDVASIQQSTIVDTLSAGRPDGDLLVSQCVFTAEEASKSVVMSVMERHPQVASSDPPQEFWRKKFSGEHEGEKEEEEKEFLPPRKIEGIGDEAYWMGGALYALKNQIVLRVSVGGADDPETKLEKSKTLAAKALVRLYP